HFAETERHYGLGDRTSVDITVEFYPSHKLVRQDNAAADTTVLIGEDGEGTIVMPPSTGGSGGKAGNGGSAARGAAGARALGGAGSGGSGGSAGKSSAKTSSDGGGCSCAMKSTGSRASAAWLVLGALLLRRSARKRRA